MPTGLAPAFGLLSRSVRILLLFAAPVFAAQAASSSDQQTLAASPQWRALLHFAPGASTSYADDKRFFLAPDGHRDPVAELQATLAAFARDPDIQCRFPDRQQWLAAQGQLPDTGLQHCQQYQQWRSQLNVSRVVLVLASSYLNSPSSMYGHTFLRLDPAGERSDSAFLSYALNFGAAIPAGENGLLYAYRGLLGGYPGLFSMQPYYEKIQEYTRLENRDMWEYQLNLSAAEVGRLLAHVWALRDIRFDYYFFDENCSFRLLELLEVARPGSDLMSPFGLAAMPVDTVRQVRDQGFVETVAFRPSRYREFQALIDTLNSDQLAQVLELIQMPSTAVPSALATTDEASRGQLALAAYRLLRYRENERRRDPEAAERSLQLLRAGHRAGMEDAQVTTPPRPDRGHRTAGITATAGVSAEQDFLDLGWRASYHDALDSLAGYPEGATLAMADITLRWLEAEGLQLQRFLPVTIRSLAPRTAFVTPLSWQVSAGFERPLGLADPGLAGMVDGGAGGSWPLFGGQLFGLAAARLEYRDEAEHNAQLAPGMRIGQLWQGRDWSAELGGEVFEFREGSRRGGSLAVNWRTGDQQALRLSVRYGRDLREHASEVALSWRWYR